MQLRSKNNPKEKLNINNYVSANISAKVLVMQTHVHHIVDLSEKVIRLVDAPIGQVDQFNIVV